MARAPGAKDLDRFRKVCGMLGSDHDGERAAAALKATTILASIGLTWQDVGFASAAARPEPRPAGRWWQDVAEAIYNSAIELNDAETDFIDNMATWDRPLSEKQEAWLRRLAAKAGFGVPA